METAQPMSKRLRWRIGPYNEDYLQIDGLDEASVMPCPFGWAVLIFGTIKFEHAWHQVSESREEAMRVAEAWFLALDIEPWEMLAVSAMRNRWIRRTRCRTRPQEVPHRLPHSSVS